MALPDLLDLTSPDANAPKEKLHNWHKRTALMSTFTWIAVFVILIPFLASALFMSVPMLGRVAWEKDEESKVDAKITTVVNPISGKVDQLGTQLKAQSDLLSDQLARSLTYEICRAAARRSKEKDMNERQRLLSAIEDMRANYFKYRGIEFNTGDC